MTAVAASQVPGILAKTPDDKELLKIANCIGNNWEFLAPFLLKKNSKARVEQIKQDISRTVMRSNELLLEWRKEAGQKACFGELFYNMQQPPSVTIDWDEIAKAVSIPKQDIYACKDVYDNRSEGPNNHQQETCTLKDVLGQDGEVKVLKLIPVKILHSQAPLEYGSNRQMKEIVIADKTAFAKALAYNREKFPLLQEGECLYISNVIKKENGVLILTSKTSIFTATTNHITVPDTIRDEALSRKAAVTSIVDAALSPENTVLNVKGKVVESIPQALKRLNDSCEEVPFKKIKVKDSTGCIEAGLWRDLAKCPVNVGDHVQLNQFYTKPIYNREKGIQVPILSSQRQNSSIQFIEQHEDDVSSDISDFDDSPLAELTGQILGIETIRKYSCCLNERCHKKKLLDNNSCGICSVKYTDDSSGKGYVAKMLLQEEKGLSAVTFFTESVENLLKSLDINSSADNFLELKEKLPIQIKYRKSGNKLSNVIAIYQPNIPVWCSTNKSISIVTTQENL